MSLQIHPSGPFLRAVGLETEFLLEFGWLLEGFFARFGCSFGTCEEEGLVPPEVPGRLGGLELDCFVI